MGHREYYLLSVPNRCCLRGSLLAFFFLGSACHSFYGMILTSIFRYYLGTGLISVVGISFSIIPVALGGFAQMYANGFCPTDADGTKLPCPDAYGALLGTAACCALIEILIAFIPPRIILKIFPPLVTGPTVMVCVFIVFQNESQLIV